MFKGCHFDRSVILVCVRWYLAYGLSLRDLEEMMAERGISVDQSTIHRWVVRGQQADLDAPPGGMSDKSADLGATMAFNPRRNHASATLSRSR